MYRVMESEDSEAREDSASEDSHPSTDASEDSVEVRVGGVTRPPPPNSSRGPSYSPQRASYSPQGSPYSPGRAYSPPARLSLPHGFPQSPRLPPKLRKCYNTLASNTLTQVFKPTQPNSQAIAFATAAAVYDRIPSPPSKKSLPPTNHDEVQSHSRRRKLAEPRRLCSDVPRKRQHSPAPDIRSHPTHLPSAHDVTIRPIKQLKLSTPEVSPPLHASSTPSPVSIPSTSLSAPPLIHPSLLSPLVRPPTISPTLSSTLSAGIPPSLLTQGWPPGTHPYHQHYTRLLGSVLPNPLALLPGGIHLPPYPIVPLLHQFPTHQPAQSPSPQPPPKAKSPKPILSTDKQSHIHDSSRKFLHDSIQEISRDQNRHQDEPVSLVKREEKPKYLFSVASLVEDSSKHQINREPLAFPSSPSPQVTSRASSPGVPQGIAADLSLNSHVTEEPSVTNSGDLRSASPLPGPSRLASDAAIPGSTLSAIKLTSSQLHQQQQQQLLRQKQRNYKNMTRERRIEANARERTRVHTISSAYEKLRSSVPSYSHNQKLSKLSILRIAASYILTLSKIADCPSDNIAAECVEETTRTIQFEGRAKKKRDD